MAGLAVHVFGGRMRTLRMKIIGNYRIKTFPLSRISTFDVVAVGLNKHHIKALIELVYRRGA